jgi:hypothetical protein
LSRGEPLNNGEFVMARHGVVLFEGYDAADDPGLRVTNGTAASPFELTGICGASTTGFNPRFNRLSGDASKIWDAAWAKA